MRNVPRLRFKEFTDEWEEKNLSSLFERITEKNTENNDNVLTISAQYGLISQTDFFNKSVAGKDLTKYYLLHRDDFAYNKSYSNGYPMGAIKRLTKYDKGIVSTLYICFKKRNNDNVSFLEQFFESKKIEKSIQDIAQEGARNHGLLNIGVGDFFDITIKIPYFEEQEKIADFLSNVDKKISITEKKLNLFNEYKKGIMQKIFNQELRFKDENGNDYPEWEENKIGKFSKVQGGYAFKSENFKEEGVPVIRISNLSNSGFGIDKNNLVFYDEIENIDSFIINKGNLLIALSGATTGKTSIYDMPYKAYLNQRVAVFKESEKFYYSFLVQFVKTTQFSNQLKNVIVAGAQPNISTKDIENFVVNLPCFEEQQKIADFLSAIDTKIEKISDELENLKEFKKGLLQQMFV